MSDTLDNKFLDREGGNCSLRPSEYQGQHLVTSKWVYDCIEKCKLLEERYYMPWKDTVVVIDWLRNIPQNVHFLVKNWRSSLRHLYCKTEFYKIKIVSIWKVDISKEVFPQWLFVTDLQWQAVKLNNCMWFILPKVSKKRDNALKFTFTGTDYFNIWFWWFFFLFYINEIFLEHFNILLLLALIKIFKVYLSKEVNIHTYFMNLWLLDK